uniref:Uncharacterized protein n=1 Tax=Anopheles culicifacies TaxID=139723 RepID=A0A182LWJ9_9DIPT
MAKPSTNSSHFHASQYTVPNRHLCLPSLLLVCSGSLPLPCSGISPHIVSPDRLSSPALSSSGQIRSFLMRSPSLVIVRMTRDPLDWLIRLASSAPRISFSYKQCTFANAFNDATRCRFGPDQKPYNFTLRFFADWRFLAMRVLTVSVDEQPSESPLSYNSILSG